MSNEDRTDEPTKGQPPGSPAIGTPCAEQYELRIGGHLGARWSTWFAGFDLTAEDDGTTVIRGPVVDQAALHGLLQKVRDLGVPLLSLSRLPAGVGVEPSTSRHHTTRQHQPGATP